MNKTNQGWWVAALCVVALTGCAADQWNSKSEDNSGYNAPRSTAGSSSSSTSSPATAAGSGAAMPPASTTPGTNSASPAQATYGMVQAIEPMPRQDLGVGVVGAAAAGGITGSPDVLYRITVRMDDGSNQTTVVDALPSYKVGDRVRYNNGAISPY